MLSVQILPPDFGIVNRRYLLSACSWTMSPDQTNAAQTSPFAIRPE